MREAPIDLSNSTLRKSLHISYGLDVSDVTFLALGQDSRAWVYRVRTADGTLLFLKVRRRVANRAGLVVPRYLHDRGVRQVIAPLVTKQQCLWTEVDGYALMLYPFVIGKTGMESGMTADQWVQYGTILRQIHSTVVTPEIARIMQCEAYVPVGLKVVRRLDAHIGSRTFDDPIAQELTTFWGIRRDEILTIMKRAKTLGQRLAEKQLASVLCHADIHTANVLVDTDHRVWITDWDETLLAPKERDLMFVVGGIIAGQVGEREEKLFFQGYGATTIDSLALTYYRYAWAANDIAAYGEEVLLRPDLGDISRHGAVDQFLRLFKPGNIVTLALASGDEWT